MEPTIIEFEGLRLSALAEEVHSLNNGYLLKGAEASLLHPFGYTKFYRHGFHSWSLACWLPLDQPIQKPQLKSLLPQTDDALLLDDFPFSGSGVGALMGEGENILLLGALSLGAVVRAGNRMISGSYEMLTDSPALVEDEELDWFLAYGNEKTVFTQYAQLLGDRLGRRGQAPTPRVWCSWYGLFTDITQEVLVQSLEGLKGLPFDVFQIDDGWQISMGDWEANSKFPDGMEALAGRIRDAGFTPGLWLAPLIVQSNSRIFNEHPDWLLRDSDGALVPAGHNWGDYFYALDTTHPEVQDWLRNLIQKVRGWGYDYLKLDFLYSSALPAVRHGTANREQAYRQGLAVVREAAGDAYILTCGSPVMASLGLADGMRIGPDVAPYWDNPVLSDYLSDPSGPSTLNAIRTSLHRLWLRPLVQVDPDVIFFRERYNLMNPIQREYLQFLGLIADFRATSDLPAWLDPGERDALKLYLERQPEIEQLDRYRYRIDGLEVDFGFIQLP